MPEKWVNYLMLQRSTVQLLRFPFSFFLMPVFWFSLAQVKEINIVHTLYVFFILHLLVYPASNGYNSYMDRDETPIGGLEKPMAPTRQLLITTVVLDVAAVTLSFLISLYFALAVLLYILASRAYSYRGIRLKKFPVIGYLTVVLFQGALTCWMVYHSCSAELSTTVPLLPLVIAGLLIGGFYPLTQVYQHEADKKDGVTTISALLGYKGTFVFTAVVYAAAVGLLGYWMQQGGQWKQFLLVQVFFLPILVYFFWWAAKVWKDTRAADFKHTMQMNWLASICTNLSFISLLIGKGFE
jgi:1,4-dihydroxy-2-naphthoate polyprenyltransferase